MLALLRLAMAGQAAYEALQRRGEAVGFAVVNAVATRFLESAGDWAIERGALNGKDAVAAMVRDDIAMRRALADQAFGAGLQRLAAIPEMRDGRPSSAVAEQGGAGDRPQRSADGDGDGPGLGKYRRRHRGSGQHRRGAAQVLSSASELARQSEVLRAEVGKFLGRARAA
jgi:hypothetical protein